MPKRIVVVHGRGAKPPYEKKRALIQQALAHGLERLDAGPLLADVPVDLAYYGDINNALLWGATQRPPRIYEPDFLERPYSYPGTVPEEAALARLFSGKTGDQSADGYRALRARYPHAPQERQLELVLTRLATFDSELSRRLMPDLWAYFMHRPVGSLIRGRLQDMLVPALQQGDQVCLIAHSMGALVAYDVLWKLSRLREHAPLHGVKLLFVTLGAPLAEMALRVRLYDANEPEDGRYPANIRLWHNFAAEDDDVAADSRLAEVFAPMCTTGLV